MTCEGYPLINYDLYVLGLLEGQDTADLDSHIRGQCVTCVSHVQRSMRLWLVFTGSLNNAEPSAQFKSRVLQIAELSKSVLTFPKSGANAVHPLLTKPLQMTALAASAATLTLCGWYAGHTSGSLDKQHILSQVTQTEQELITSRGEVRREKDRVQRANEGSGAEGSRTITNQLFKLRSRVSQSEAALSQYKALLERQQKSSDNANGLLLALSSPGARLIPMRGAASSPGSIGYAILFPNSKLVFVGSNLLDLSGGREYQLWILRKTEAPVSAGMFIPDQQGRAYVEVDDATMSSDVSGLAVTDEPAGGSAAPTGSKFLISET